MQKVDEYISNKTKWKNELNTIRRVLSNTELVEDFKWTTPVYTLNGKNVVGMAGWKNYAGLWFFQGVFLKDKHKLLINAQEDKTKGLRQLRFNSIDEIDVDILKEYIDEAIQNQKDGKEIKIVRTKKEDIEIPIYLKAQFENVEGLEKAFNNLALGKQKDYTAYIATAKQEKTKLSRLEKITPMIMEGVGLHDKYKNC